MTLDVWPRSPWDREPWEAGLVSVLACPRLPGTSCPRLALGKYLLNGLGGHGNCAGPLHLTGRPAHICDHNTNDARRVPSALFRAGCCSFPWGGGCLRTPDDGQANMPSSEERGFEWFCALRESVVKWDLVFSEVNIRAGAVDGRWGECAEGGRFFSL